MRERRAEDIFEAALNGYGIPLSGCNIIAGVSGGADSVVLLRLLCEFSKQYGYTVTVAHVNHGLRGTEADRDEHFVESLCKKLSVKYAVCRIDCAALARENGEGVEEAGRRARYDFFRSVCRESDGALIATAHTADDNAETVLLNLTRGASLKGLCGIPAQRDGIIRPLLGCTRDDIEDYCRRNGQEYVTDSTNLHDDYTRNRIRHRIVPELKGINPAFCAAVSRMCELNSEDEKLLAMLAEELWNRALCGELSFDAEVLRSAQVPLRRRVYARAYSELSGARVRASARVQEADKVLFGECVSSQLSGSCTVKLANGILSFFSPCEALCTEAPAPLSVTVGDTVKFADYTVRLRIIGESPENSKINELFKDSRVDCDTIRGTLVLRGRCEGDKITLRHRGVTKSLKKLFNEDGVPAERRNTVPVLSDDSGVVWVYGYGADARCAANNTTKRIICVEGNRNE